MVRAFLNHPKNFAYAGFLAMIPKCLIGLSIGITLSVLAGENACLSFLMLSYPFVAFIVDGLLYGLRNRLWQPLSSNAMIPPEWEIEATELEQYARNLPKIRLMRIVTIPTLMAIFVPFLKEDDTLAIVLFDGFVAFFFLSVLFDPLWRRFFKLTKPKIIKFHPQPIQTNFSTTTYSNDECQYDANDDDNNPAIAGTMAWLAKRHLE